MTRDELYYKMKAENVLARRYFYPLISDFPCYRGLPTAGHDNLSKATKMADHVLCLPMHHKLSAEDVERIIGLIVK